MRKTVGAGSLVGLQHPNGVRLVTIAPAVPAMPSPLQSPPPPEQPRGLPIGRPDDLRLDLLLPLVIGIAGGIALRIEGHDHLVRLVGRSVVLGGPAALGALNAFRASEPAFGPAVRRSAWAVFLLALGLVLPQITRSPDLGELVFIGAALAFAFMLGVAALAAVVATACWRIARKRKRGPPSQPGAPRGPT